MDRADRDNDFARILDDERAEIDRDVDAEAAQPAPAQAPAVETPAQVEPVQANDEGPAVEQSADSKATAAAAFQAALNALNADDASATADGAVAGQTADASTEANAATPTTATAPAATAAATASAAQSNPALLILAAANAASTVSGTQSSGKQTGETGKTDSSDETSDGDTSSTEGSGIAALAGVIQPAAVQTAAQIATASAETKAGISPATGDGASAAPLLADMAAAGDATATPAKDAKHADTAPTQSATSPASSQPNAHAAANSATQANAVAAAAASTDGASQLAANTSSATSQANAQTVATGTASTDAARAAPTPPALQSAPAATIQVYTRIIERADGRAQRFEVRLDPAELGRVDIRIEIGADKKVHAVMAAHDSAAMTDLMRGQKALERALTDAGIDLADNGLRFEVASDSSRGGASQQRDGDANGRSGQSDAWRKFDTTTIPVSAEAAAAATPMRRTQRLDLVA